MKVLLAVLFTVSSALPAAAAETHQSARKPSCVKVDLLDQDNLPVKGQPEVVGLLVGGRPILAEQDIPRHAGVRTGSPTPCPGALVEMVAGSYRDSCLTIERRAATAKENMVTPESVLAQCQTIQEALGDSLTPLPKK